MNRIIALPALCAFVALLAPISARADEEVATQSCSLLKQSAEMRAEQLYDTISGKVLKWSRWQRYLNWGIEGEDCQIPPNLLPEAVAAFRKVIPGRAFELARSTRTLGDSPEAQKVA